MKQSHFLLPSPTLTAVCPGVSQVASQCFMCSVGEGGGHGCCLGHVGPRGDCAPGAQRQGARPFANGLGSF